MKPRILFSTVAFTILTSVACQPGKHGRVDTTALTRDQSAIHLRVAIAGARDDPRVNSAASAISFWNSEFARLGRRVRLDSAFAVTSAVSDDLLRAGSGEAPAGGGPATTKIRALLRDVPADIVIALSTTDLISFSSRWDAGQFGIVGVRRIDIPPLSLPNTLQNVIAHELGHVLGLAHNSDNTTLMCGRPASCRPADFASDQPRFFPLTPADESLIRDRWP